MWAGVEFWYTMGLGGMGVVLVLVVVLVVVVVVVVHACQGPRPKLTLSDEQVRPSKSRCGSSTWNSSRLGRLPMASSSAGSSLPHLRRAAGPRQLSPRPLALKAALALQMSDSGSPTWQLSARGQVAMQSRMQLRAVHSGT